MKMLKKKPEEVVWQKEQLEQTKLAANKYMDKIQP